MPTLDEAKNRNVEENRGIPPFSQRVSYYHPRGTQGWSSNRPAGPALSETSPPSPFSPNHLGIPSKTPGWGGPKEDMWTRELLEYHRWFTSINPYQALSTTKSEAFKRYETNTSAFINHWKSALVNWPDLSAELWLILKCFRTSVSCLEKCDEEFMEKFSHWLCYPTIDVFLAWIGRSSHLWGTVVFNTLFRSSVTKMSNPFKCIATSFSEFR